MLGGAFTFMNPLCALGGSRVPWHPRDGAVGNKGTEGWLVPPHNLCVPSHLMPGLSNGDGWAHHFYMLGI